MCATIWFDGREIATRGEAAEAFGNHVVWTEGAISLLGYPMEDVCICGVDLNATAEALGLELVSAGMDYAMVPEGAPLPFDGEI